MIHDIELALAVIALAASVAALADKKRARVWLAVASVACNLIWVIRLA